MKIYNPFNKIRELNRELEALRHEYLSYMQKTEEINKEHKCGAWCNGCKNFMEIKYKNFIGMEITEKFCILDNPCKDREIENE